MTFPSRLALSVGTVRRIGAAARQASRRHLGFREFPSPPSRAAREPCRGGCGTDAQIGLFGMRPGSIAELCVPYS
jgi:hypothetical protein